MQSTYALEKFKLAVVGLAIGTSILQVRLANAYVYRIALMEAEQMPKDIREDFVELKKRLSDLAPLASGGSAKARVSDEDAIQLASQIVEMYFRFEAGL